MESIIASGPSDNNPKQHVFLVKWKDFSHEENTWETFFNVASHDKKLLEEYCGQIPTIATDARFRNDKKKKKGSSTSSEMSI